MSKNENKFLRRSATKIEMIKKKYGKDFEVKSDKKLGNYLKKRGYPSLSKLLKMHHKIKNL